MSADIAAHAGNNRDEGNQGDNLLERGLEYPHQITGDDTAEEIGHQPGKAQAGNLQRPVAVQQFFFARPGHHVNIFGRLLAHDIDYIVDGDDPLEFILLIDDRDRQQIVLGDNLRHLLLVGFGADAEHVAGHDVLQCGARRHGQQLAQRQDANQMSVHISHIE